MDRKGYDKKDLICITANMCYTLVVSSSYFTSEYVSYKNGLCETRKTILFCGRL